jgi:arylformamidase
MMVQWGPIVRTPANSRLLIVISPFSEAFVPHSLRNVPSLILNGYPPDGERQATKCGPGGMKCDNPAMAAVLDPQFIEREYNNRALVPEHPAFFARWERDSEFVRSTLPCTLDLAYGRDPRERLDWFPAANPRGTLVFVHGGYWRSLDKSMFSWLAASYVAAGLNVAMPSYRLCPSVRIDDIVTDIVGAMNWVMGTHGPAAKGKVVVAGHSAGGHLVGALFATPDDRFVFDPARIVGGVSLSGLFDFAPLRIHSFNSDFGLDEAAVARLNLYDKPTTLKAPLVVAAGGSRELGVPAPVAAHRRELGAAGAPGHDPARHQPLQHRGCVRRARPGAAQGDTGARLSAPDLSRLSIDRETKSFTPRKRRRWLNKWTIGAVVLALVGVAFAMRSANAPVAVETATVTTAYPTASFTDLNATGRVSAFRKAAVSTKATGRLEWLGVQEGSRVKAGEVIARLENLDVAAARDSAGAGANAARANLEQGEAEAARREDRLRAREGSLREEVHRRVRRGHRPRALREGAGLDLEPQGRDRRGRGERAQADVASSRPSSARPSTASCSPRTRTWATSSRRSRRRTTPRARW